MLASAVTSVVSLVLIGAIARSHRKMKGAIARHSNERFRVDFYPSVTIVRPIKGLDVYSNYSVNDPRPFKKDLDLSYTEALFLTAVPVVLGSLARIPLGWITDRRETPSPITAQPDGEFQQRTGSSRPGG